MPYAFLKQPSGNSGSSFLQLPRPPKRIEAAPESGMPSSSTRPTGLWEWGTLPVELPPAPGRASRRTLAGLQGVGWECETRRPFSLGMEGRRGTDGLHSCSISVSAVCGSVTGRTFLPRCPQVNAPEPGMGWQGGPSCQGVPEHLCRAAMGGLCVGSPSSVPRRPHSQVRAGWPVPLL